MNAQNDRDAASIDDQEIHIRVVGSTTVVDLPPMVRRAVAEKMGTLLGFIIRSRPPALLLNFSRVERIESSGIAACLFAQKECAHTGLRLGVFGVSTQVKRLFTIARIDSFFKFFEDEPAALIG